MKETHRVLEINLSIYDRPKVRMFYKKLKKVPYYKHSDFRFTIKARVITAAVPVDHYDEFYTAITEAIGYFFPESNITKIKNNESANQ